MVNFKKGHEALKKRKAPRRMLIARKEKILGLQRNLWVLFGKKPAA